MPRGVEFRKRAQECYRLSTQLHQPEHRSFAIELAKAWIDLAEYSERKTAAQSAADLMGKTEGGDLGDCSFGDGPTS